MAAYNAGEGAVSRARKRHGRGGTGSFWELRLPRETSTYVPRLLALSAVVADPQAYGIQLPEISVERAFIQVSTHSQIDLAKAAQALETDVDTLTLWNPHLNQWATPPKGPHRLIIPVGLADGAQLSLNAIPAAERVAWQRVEIRSGDTLSTIAVRYGTDVATLQKVNELRNHTIRAGHALLIPKPSADLSAYPAQARHQKADYTIKPGDSLWTISREYDVSMASLMKANHVGPTDVLRVGQKIRIPGAGPATKSQNVVRSVKYRVRKGDSLSLIAGKFSVQVHDIVRWNELDDSKYLQPGQSLQLHVNLAGAD